MNQGDMSINKFDDILDTHITRYGIPRQVSLQGEGEPTLHKKLFEMAGKVRDIGSHPYTITNGSFKNPSRFIESFTTVGVSLDTLNEKKAESIGRFNLKRTLEFIEYLSRNISIIIHTTDMSLDLQRIREFCYKRRLRHVVQPLQSKPDYAYRYPKLVDGIEHNGMFQCRFISEPRMRYYSLEGIEMPCCFIKDTTHYNGLKELKYLAATGLTPHVCRNCIYGHSRRK